MHSSNDPTVVAAAIATTRTTTPAHGIDDDDDGTAPPDNVDLWIKPVHSMPFVRMASYQGIITEQPLLGLTVVRHQAVTGINHGQACPVIGLRDGHDCSWNGTMMTTTTMMTMTNYGAVVAATVAVATVP